MKNLKITLLSICFILLSLNLSSCGQKGPLIVEQPPVVEVEALDGDENTDETEEEAEDLESEDE